MAQTRLWVNRSDGCWFQPDKSPYCNIELFASHGHRLSLWPLTAFLFVCVNLLVCVRTCTHNCCQLLPASPAAWWTSNYACCCYQRNFGPIIIAQKCVRHSIHTNTHTQAVRENQHYAPENCQFFNAALC